MKHKDSKLNSNQEVNLKLFIQKILKHKLLFVLSVLGCMALAFIYIKLATPKYEASTSILIDASGSTRSLGDSKYVDGGVGMIEVEKNLYNEIGIIKSFSLIRETVEDLGYDITYYTEDWLKKKEAYGYYPFEVIINKEHSQLFGIPFEIKLISKEKYRLSIQSDEFTVSNPATDSNRRISRKFSYSKEFTFGEPVVHDYFNFTLNRPDYKFVDEDFNEEELSFTLNNLDGVANSYMSKLSVSNIDIQASIFKLSSSGPVIGKEVDFLKKLTENYVASKLTSRNKIALAKESFIRNQLKVVSDSLTKVEASLERFKKEKRALNLSATATNALGRTSNLQVEKAKIELNIEYYNSLIQNVRANRTTDEFVIPTAVGIDDPLINANIVELKELYAERSRKKFYVTSGNQEMTILNNQINQSTDLLLNNLRNAVKSAEYSLNRVNSQLSSFNGVISSLPMQENQLLTIERQSALYENLFNYLSQELAKTGIAGAENISDTKILDEARMVGSGPVSPQKKLILLLGFLIGLLLPLAWIVLFSPNDLIENISQILVKSDIPVIASIVHYDTKAKKAKSDISLWKHKESFRDLCTNLRFVSAKETSVFGLTSVMPEEGKTYTSINLGITFAEAGKKTLIIDADLRNPSLVSRASKIEGKGLSNFLQGDGVALKDIIHSHETLKNLKFIPTFEADGNVHELLSGKRIQIMIEELKKEFDYIIIDTPATGLVSDFMLLSEVIDVNLFVIRRNLAKIKFLNDLENLVSNQEKKSFIIFNDIAEKDHKYGYEEKYGRNKEEQLVNKSLSI